MDLRTELQHIHERGFRWYEQNLGKVVLWHEYHSEASQFDDTYDEGGRVYFVGVPITALWVIVSEDTRNQSETGRRPTERITMAFSMRTLETSAISEPQDYARHLNDIVRYDNRLWRLDSYNIRGDITASTIVGIEGVQIFEDEEMMFDTPSEGMAGTSLQRSMPYPNRSFQEFPDHDGPGEYTGVNFLG